MIDSIPSDELLPCPHCGSAKVRVENDGRGSLAVHCAKCFCYGPWAQSDRSAIAWWNRRNTPETGKPPMTSADVARVFAPLPPEEAAALREYGVDDSSDETCEVPHQAPIAKIIVREGWPDGLQVTLYAPGLPPGEHDVYLDSSAPGIPGNAQKAEVQRHSRDCDCHDCHYAKKHPQVKPHHARCGCFECAPNAKSEEVR